MKRRPCRLCFDTGLRYVADQPDVLTVTFCPCLDPIRDAFLEATDTKARAALDAVDLPVDGAELGVETEGSSA